jgi:hypothetical protein
MEFSNDKLATKHFLLSLGHFDTTMVFSPRKLQALQHLNVVEGGLYLHQLHFG